MDEATHNAQGAGGAPIPAGAAGRERLLWIGLLAFVAAWGFLFSLIQPLGGPGDEDAHIRYVRFLADEGRLPEWRAEGGGEAGYESQHPPLYYAAAALVYSLTGPLPEHWRWYALRWLSLALGIALFAVARAFALDYFHDRFRPAFAATAAFMLMPTTLLHISYVNVDLASVLWCSIVLWMAVRVARGEASPRDRVALAAAFGLGLLTKLTALGMLPAVVLAYVWDPRVAAGKEREQRLVRAALTLLGAAAIAGWWYARNSWLYGTPFTHTTGRYGSGLLLTQVTGRGLQFLAVTLRETYLSTWAQRSWLPTWFVAPLYAPLTAILALAAVGGVIGCRARGRGDRPFDPAPWICGVTILVLFLGHQAQVWLVDYEFNAGGRYLLNGMLGACALIVAGLEKLRWQRVWPAVLVGLLVLADLVAAVRIVTVLNPRHYPDWRPLGPRQAAHCPRSRPAAAVRLSCCMLSRAARIERGAERSVEGLGPAPRARWASGARPKPRGQLCPRRSRAEPF